MLTMLTHLVKEMQKPMSAERHGNVMVIPYVYNGKKYKFYAPIDRSRLVHPRTFTCKGENLHHYDCLPLLIETFEGNPIDISSSL